MPTTYGQDGQQEKPETQDRVRCLADLAVGQQALIVERIENEVRTVRYMRRAGVSHLPGYVPTYRLSCVQGAPGEPPRYSFHAGLYPYPQHSFGAALCQEAGR